MCCLFDHSFCHEYYHSAVLCILQGQTGTCRKKERIPYRRRHRYSNNQKQNHTTVGR